MGREVLRLVGGGEIMYRVYSIINKLIENILKFVYNFLFYFEN